MMKGGDSMKALKINDGKGEYSKDGSTYFLIDKITKEDISDLLEIALDTDVEFEMDNYDSELITNPAHRIIYGNLHGKLSEIVDNKDRFNLEVDELYKEAYRKYTPPSQTVDETDDAEVPATA